jgi:hypothetical protein
MFCKPLQQHAAGLQSTTQHKPAQAIKNYSVLKSAAFHPASLQAL